MDKQQGRCSMTSDESRFSVKVYDLREDAAYVAAIQHATLFTRDFGLKPIHGLFGSDEWWRAIEHGELPKQVLEGEISRVFMSGHNGYPEFTVSAGGKKTDWTRQGEERYYKVGKWARITYVIEEFKKPGLGTTEVVLSIEIEQNVISA